ncbi:hypothetical protein LAZ67_X001989 [Cordylochernes scorpioides]|uniref:Uncharacterized protein n=1 Tax=Cordylochernes scorpioides TaxID=51811 RepID=A0ABY6LX54_9ARAC|nr:hypothetical protein LAZ67_X001989 [Cordylochernes scorpioides]
MYIFTLCTSLLLWASEYRKLRARPGPPSGQQRLRQGTKPSGSNHERPHGTSVNHRWTPGVRGSGESGRRGELTSLIRINLNLGVTELRRSRRLQGREPILQPLPQRIEMEDDHRPTVSGSYLPCQRQRDPSTFSGDGNINPGQWLKEYERVSKYN